MYFKYLICSFIFALLFSLVNFDIDTIKDAIYLTTISIGSICITLFVIIDYIWFIIQSCGL